VQQGLDSGGLPELELGSKLELSFCELELGLSSGSPSSPEQEKVNVMASTRAAESANFVLFIENSLIVVLLRSNVENDFTFGAYFA